MSEGDTHGSQPERDAFNWFADNGMIELTRDRVTDYTYWDFQKLRFPRNEGMRIDLLYASATLAVQATEAHIDCDERKDKCASDHVPVTVDLAFKEGKNSFSPSLKQGLDQCVKDCSSRSFVSFCIVGIRCPGIIPASDMNNKRIRNGNLV